MSRAKLFTLLIALAVALFAAGCGTADINFHTIVHSSGEVTQEVNIEATGLMAEAFKESANIEEAKAEGWQIFKEVTEDSLSLKMSKRFSREEAESMVIPLSASSQPGAEPAGEPSQPQMSFDIQDSLFFRDYALTIKLPPSETQPTSPGEDEELAKLGEEMLKALEESFSFSWTVTLPGEVTETNADERTGNSATWKLSFKAMSEGQEFVVKSRETRWSLIGLIGGGVVLVVVIIVALFIVMRRRRPASPVTTGG